MATFTQWLVDIINSVHLSRNESPHHFRNCPQISVQPPRSTQAARAQWKTEVGYGFDSSVKHVRFVRLENI